MGYVLKIHVHEAIIVLIRALLKAQSIGIMVAWVTKNRKANKNLTAFKRKLPKHNLVFSDNQ